MVRSAGTHGGPWRWRLFALAGLVAVGLDYQFGVRPVALSAAWDWAYNFTECAALAACVVRAVRAVAGGERYVHPSLGAVLAAPTSAGPLGELTSREREVLRLLALGHTNQEIAESLIVSVRTVESHRAHVMAKLRVTTRAGLVRAALDAGLLDEGR